MKTKTFDQFEDDVLAKGWQMMQNRHAFQPGMEVMVADDTQVGMEFVLDELKAQMAKGGIAGPRPSWLDGGAEAVAMLREDEERATSQCDHQWTDDGEHLLICTECGAQEDHDPKWRDIATAPRDGTMVRLLVEFSDHSTEDAEQAPTIGANNFDNGGEDSWQFAGWCWTHDHFTEGKGEPVGWLPMLEEPRCTPAALDVAGLMREHRIAVTPEHEGQWHADLYGHEAEPLARAEGDTPEEAVHAVIAAHRAKPVPDHGDDIPSFDPGNGNKARRRAELLGLCMPCGGSGTIGTGISESPSTICNKCDGTGKLAEPTATPSAAVWAVASARSD